jgi:hypothetical protein
VQEGGRGSAEAGGSAHSLDHPLPWPWGRGSRPRSVCARGRRAPPHPPPDLVDDRDERRQAARRVVEDALGVVVRQHAHERQRVRLGARRLRGRGVCDGWKLWRGHAGGAASEAAPVAPSTPERGATSTHRTRTCAPPPPRPPPSASSQALTAHSASTTTSVTPCAAACAAATSAGLMRDRMSPLRLSWTCVRICGLGCDAAGLMAAAAEAWARMGAGGEQAARQARARDPAPSRCRPRARPRRRRTSCTTSLAQLAVLNTHWLNSRRARRSTTSACGQGRHDRAGGVQRVREGRKAPRWHMAPTPHSTAPGVVRPRRTSGSGPGTRPSSASLTPSHTVL